MPDLTRRVFITRLGQGSFALAVTACGLADSPTLTAARSVSTDSAAPSSTNTISVSTTGSIELVRAHFERIDLGIVAAYAVIRGGDAAVVDTGVNGSADAIGAALAGLGLGWDAVGHVLLTHNHPDHVGSIGDVAALAPSALIYAGPEDISGISSPREISPLSDGQQVFGLTAVTTPGHTSGHVSFFDPEASVLVAGDALTGASDGVGGPNPSFSDDMTLANQSVVKLAGLSFETAYFGHGEPVPSSASGLVAELAAHL